MSCLSRLAETAMRRVPKAAPPMMRNSAGWIMTSIGPPSRMKPTNTLNVTTARPMIASMK